MDHPSDGLPLTSVDAQIPSLDAKRKESIDKAIIENDLKRMKWASFSILKERAIQRGSSNAGATVTSKDYRSLDPSINPVK